MCALLWNALKNLGPISRTIQRDVHGSNVTRADVGLARPTESSQCETNIPQRKPMNVPNVSSERMEHDDQQETLRTGLFCTGLKLTRSDKFVIASIRLPQNVEIILNFEKLLYLTVGKRLQASNIDTV